MADIRLKKITVEAQQSPLIIQNGDVTINSTTTSDSILTGSFVTKGGISITGSVDSNSSTSGGALTVGGGIGIMKNAYIGKNLVLDSTNSILQINGLSTNRLFLDTITNKNFYISPDGVNKRLELNDTLLQINITNPSTNSSSGALCVSGGISIGSTTDVSNGSNGGALTVAGGVSIAKNINVVGTIETSNGIIVNNCDNQLTLNNSLNVSSSTINVTGDHLYVNNFTGDIDILSSTGNINLNQNLTVNHEESIFSKRVLVSDTTPFTNMSTSSLVIYGGVSIANTTDAVSISNGGLSVAGGVSIHKHTFMGDSLSIDQSNSKRNKIILSGNITQSEEFTGFGNTEGSIVYQIPDISSSHIFYATSNEIFKITGEGDIRLSGKTQSYTIVGGGKNDTDLSFQSGNSSEKSSINFFTQDGTATEDNDICIFGLGLPSQTSDSEYLRLGWDSTNNYYEIGAKHSGTGILRDLVLGNKHIIIQTTGNILFNNQTVVDNIFDIISTENSTGVSTGSLRVAGGVTIKKDLFLGSDFVLGSDVDYQIKMNTTLNNNFSTLTITGSQNKYPSINIIGDTSVSSTVYPFDFSMYSLGNPNSLNNESLKISTTTNGYYIKTTHEGVGFARFIDIHSLDNYNQLMLQTSGNVGIGVEEPVAKLDINGILHCNDIVTFTSSTDSINSSTASLVMTGGISIMTSTESESITNGGSLTIAGGASIAKNVFIGGVTHFLNETPSTSYLEASVVIHGGLSIQAGDNATNVGNGGGLSVAGGASVGGDLYVGGSINGSGSSSSTYAYLTLTSVDDAINYSTGSLVTYGGITIQTDTNALGVGTGGSLLAAGGASIAKDVYIGGNTYFSGGVTNYKSISDNIINMYDNFNIRRFSINKSTVSHAFSISRYDSLGNHVERTFDISNSDGSFIFNNTTTSTSKNSASVVFLGGMSISNTNPAVTLENGGSLTVAGGMSISKNVNIGGDIIFYSSTPSNNVSTGAVLISGGVGISGDVNVLGNTQIIGNLTVNGQTTSINAVNTVIKDNVLVLNSGPTGSRDSGFIVQRYQEDNDTGSGDVVADLYPEIITLPNQSGMNSTQIKFSMSSSAIDDHYTGQWLKIASGFSNNQIRKITSYNGTTKIATVSSDWTTQNPSGGDNVYVYNKPFVGLLYNEINDRFELGSSVQNPGQSNVVFSDHLPLYAGSATYISTAVSSNSSSGSVLIAGGISISNTTDASSITRGGTITTSGGGSIGKTLYVGERLYVNNTQMTPNTQDRFTSVLFTAQNNQSTFTDITDLYFDNTIWGFDIYLCAKILASSNLYANFHIRGVNKNGSWEIIKTYVGDDTGIQFHITDFGQIQYTTPNFSGFTSCQFKYRVFVN